MIRVTIYRWRERCSHRAAEDCYRKGGPTVGTAGHSNGMQPGERGSLRKVAELPPPSIRMATAPTRLMAQRSRENKSFSLPAVSFIRIAEKIRPAQPQAARGFRVCPAGRELYRE